MTNCAIKVCRNYRGRNKTTRKVTYHRIPSDPIMRNRWVDIIRRSRAEDYWKPTKTTVICSDHFHKKDMYFVSNQERRKLKKEAIPSKALFLSSVYSDESDNSDEKSSQESNSPATNKETETSSIDVLPSTSTVKNCDSIVHADISSPSTSITDNKITELTENKSETSEDFSDLDSIYDSPKKAKMRKELRSKIRMQKKHVLKIQSLRRKNIRLEKKLTSYKEIIGILKKKRYIDNRHDVLCCACRGPLCSESDSE